MYISQNPTNGQFEKSTCDSVWICDWNNVVLDIKRGFLSINQKQPLFCQSTCSQLITRLQETETSPVASSTARRIALTWMTENIHQHDWLWCVLLLWFTLVFCTASHVSSWVSSFFQQIQPVLIRKETNSVKCESTLLWPILTFLVGQQPLVTVVILMPAKMKVR